MGLRNGLRNGFINWIQNCCIWFDANLCERFCIWFEKWFDANLCERFDVKGFVYGLRKCLVGKVLCERFGVKLEMSGILVFE